MHNLASAGWSLALALMCAAVLPAFAAVAEDRAAAPPMPAKKSPAGTAQRPAFTPPKGSGIPADYRKRWQQLTKLAFSGMHWNQSVMVYSNAPDATYRHNQDTWWEQEQNSGWSSDDEQAAPFKTYARGTVLVKEGFKVDEKGRLTPTFLATMVKRESGFDPEHGDWEYLQSSPQGKVLLRGGFSSAGVRAACADCHTNVAERDYVFSTTGKGS
jgi:hypothetical protein